MKTTIDIPDKELSDAMKFTGAKTTTRGGRQSSRGFQPP
jgi:hypothetical protein